MCVANVLGEHLIAGICVLASATPVSDVMGAAPYSGAAETAERMVKQLSTVTEGPRSGAPDLPDHGRRFQVAVKAAAAVRTDPQLARLSTTTYTKVDSKQ
jgi:hypothetical protein